MSKRPMYFLLLSMISVFSASGQILYDSFESDSSIGNCSVPSPINSPNVVKIGSVYNANDSDAFEEAVDFNLSPIRNGSFDNGTSNWQSCGAPTASAQYPTLSGNALAFGQPCAGGTVSIAQSNLQIDPNADDYTLSFHFYMPAWDSNATIPSIYATLGDQASLSGTLNYTTSTRLQPLFGWHEYRFVMSKAQIQRTLSNFNNASLTITVSGLSTNSDEPFKIDQVSLIPYVYSAPMGYEKLPAGLKQSCGSNRLLSTIMHNGKMTVGSMNFDGSDAEVYTGLSGYLFSGTSFDNNIIIGSQFVGLDGYGNSVGVDRYDTSLNRTNIYQAIGGLNLTYEYYGATVSKQYNRRIITSCAARLDVISNPACIAEFRQLNGSEIPNVDRSIPGGTHFDISSKGMIAYVSYSDSQYNLALTDHNHQNKKEYYLAKGVLVSGMDWSPNGKLLAISNQQTGGKFQANKVFDRITVLAVDSLTSIPKEKTKSFVVVGLYGRPVWTPDNKYIIFTKQIAAPQGGYFYQTWWLEYATGRRGRISTFRTTIPLDILK